MTPDAGDGTADVGAELRALLDRAVEVYRDEPEAAAVLAELRRRLDEPLRVALVGRVKAGKSTLLNALVGARIAPTDAGECTRVVTVYRHGAVPRVVLHDLGGGARSLPVRRADGGLQLELAGTPPDEVAYLSVDWPAAGLAPATLVDTPGIASLSTGTSARTQSFVQPAGELSGADAVVFLTRQMQAEDVAFLSDFQAATGSSDVHTTTLTVLSRADEVGAGRLDALLAAQAVARRMIDDPAIRAVSSAVLPIAGLLALGGSTLRHADYVALRSLAHGEPGQVETMLLSADRFCRADAPIPVSRVVRTSLLQRLGMFGIRLSVALIRAGLDDAQELADELVARSGLAELQRLIAVQFTRRGAALKAGAALSRLEALLRRTPLPGSDELWGELERIRLAFRDLAELEVLARSRARGGMLPGPLQPEGERLLGCDGTDARSRLGLPAEASDDDVQAAALAAISRWQAVAADPMTARPTADAADVVVRSCEGVLAELATGGSAGAD